MLLLSTAWLPWLGAPSIAHLAVDGPPSGKTRETAVELLGVFCVGFGEPRVLPTLCEETRMACSRMVQRFAMFVAQTPWAPTRERITQPCRGIPSSRSGSFFSHPPERSSSAPTFDPFGVRSWAESLRASGSTDPPPRITSDYARSPAPLARALVRCICASRRSHPSSGIGDSSTSSNPIWCDFPKM